MTIIGYRHPTKRNVINLLKYCDSFADKHRRVRKRCHVWQVRGLDDN